LVRMLRDAADLSAAPPRRILTYLAILGSLSILGGGLTPAACVKERRPMTFSFPIEIEGLRFKIFLSTP